MRLKEVAAKMRRDEDQDEASTSRLAAAFYSTAGHVFMCPYSRVIVLLRRAEAHRLLNDPLASL